MSIHAVVAHSIVLCIFVHAQSGWLGMWAEDPLQHAWRGDHGERVHASVI
jgi:hypothetical protein